MTLHITTLSTEYNDKKGDTQHNDIRDDDTRYAKFLYSEYRYWV